jgi:hypothetical protein
MYSRLLGNIPVYMAVLILLPLLTGCDSHSAPILDPVALRSSVTTQETTPPETVYGRVSGGGHVREGMWDISFAGQVRALGTEHNYVSWADADRWTSYDPKGQWVIQFHSVSAPALSGGTFKSTEFLDATFSLKRQPTSACVSATTFTAVGRFNGEPGWTVWVRMADAGHRAEKGAYDSFRVAVWAPGDHPDSNLKAFDTFEGMTANATCLGGKKRDLASGNLKIDLKF